MKLQVRIVCGRCGADLTPDPAQQNVLVGEDGAISFDRARPWAFMFMPKASCHDGLVRVAVNLGPERVDL